MNAQKITELHERAGLILERIASMQSMIEIHKHNLFLYRNWLASLEQKQMRKIEMRERAISRCWRLYNDAMKEIYELTIVNQYDHENENY